MSATQKINPIQGPSATETNIMENPKQAQISQASIVFHYIITISDTLVKGTDNPDKKRLYEELSHYFRADKARILDNGSAYHSQKNDENNSVFTAQVVAVTMARKGSCSDFSQIGNMTNANPNESFVRENFKPKCQTIGVSTSDSENNNASCVPACLGNSSILSLKQGEATNVNETSTENDPTTHKRRRSEIEDDAAAEIVAIVAKEPLDVVSRLMNEKEELQKKISQIQQNRPPTPRITYMFDVQKRIDELLNQYEKDQKRIHDIPNRIATPEQEKIKGKEEKEWTNVPSLIV